MKTKQIVTGILAAAFLVMLAIILPNLWVNVNADQICVTQDPIDGDLHFYFSAGMKSQNFGKVTKYPKEFQFWFSKMEDQGTGEDQSIKVRFNDGGHAQLSGSARCRLPLTEEGMRKIHTKYGSEKAVQEALVRTVVEKSVYMTGPLMSSKESYAERRNDLISFISDQTSNGIYKTETHDEKGVDLLSGKEKTITVVDPIKNANGIFERQEESPLQAYEISLYNFSINSIDYDSVVEKQIRSQQQAIMDVQTAIAEAKKAEQEAIKVEEQGKANAARSKWEQEVIKAKMVTEAEQKKEVAELNMQAAEFYKKQQILEGEGDARKKELVMSADGALTQKLAAWTSAQQFWADAFSKYSGNITPQWVSGESKVSSNAVNDFMNLMNMQAAKSLGLNMEIPKGGNK